MKKFKYFIITLVALLCISMSAIAQETQKEHGNTPNSDKTPINLNIRLGDSELSGILGLEFKVANFSLSGGWRPFNIDRIPDLQHPEYYKKRINSLGAALTFYFKSDKSSFYITGGETTDGYAYHKEQYLDQYVTPAYMAMGGYRFVLHQETPEIPKRLSLNTGLGCKFAKYHPEDHSLVFIFEFVLNFSVVKQ